VTEAVALLFSVLFVCAAVCGSVLQR